MNRFAFRSLGVAAEAMVFACLVFVSSGSALAEKAEEWDDEEQAAAEVDFRWVDERGAVLPLSWKTEAHWVWRQAKNGSSAQRPALRVRIEVPDDHQVGDVSVSNDGAVEWKKAGPRQVSLYSRELHTAATFKVLAANGVERTIALIAIPQRSSLVLIHRSCAELNHRLEEASAGERARFLFVGAYCERSERGVDVSIYTSRGIEIQDADVETRNQSKNEGWSTYSFKDLSEEAPQNLAQFRFVDDYQKSKTYLLRTGVFQVRQRIALSGFIRLNGSQMVLVDGSSTARLGPSEAFGLGLSYGKRLGTQLGMPFWGEGGAFLYSSEVKGFGEGTLRHLNDVPLFQFRADFYGLGRWFLWKGLSVALGGFVGFPITGDTDYFKTQMGFLFGPQYLFMLGERLGLHLESRLSYSLLSENDFNPMEIRALVSMSYGF